MQEIKQSVLALCCCLIVSGFFIKLFPKNKLQKNVKLLFSVIMLTVIISPLFRGVGIGISEINNSNQSRLDKAGAEEYYKTFMAEKTLDKYLDSIKNHLKTKNFEFINLDVEYEITESGIEIKNVVVTTHNENDGNKAKKEIESKFGVSARIEVIEKNEET